MIGGIIVFSFLFCLFSIPIYADTKNQALLRTMIGTIVFCILSIYLFASSDYKEKTEKHYPIYIAANEVAYICREDSITNISCKFNQNLSNKDIYVETEYPGYWVWYLYVDKKTEIKVIKALKEPEA